MITNWKLKNFKSVRACDLEFKPLTVFAGANSSGKSTIIQSILLTAQTCNFKENKRSAILNGDLTNLGKFDDINSAFSADQEVSIEFACSPVPQGKPLSRHENNTPQKIICGFSFSPTVSDENSVLEQTEPSITGSTLNCTFINEGNCEDFFVQSKLTNRYKSKCNTFGNAINFGDFSRILYDYDINISENLKNIKELDDSIETIGLDFFQFIPKSILFVVNTIYQNAYLITESLKSNKFYSANYDTILERNILLSNSVINTLHKSLDSVSGIDSIFNNPNHQNSEDNSIYLIDLIMNIDELESNVINKIRKCFNNTENLKNSIISSIESDIIETSKNEMQEIVYYNLPCQIKNSRKFLLKMFEHNIKYLGPIRDEPKSIYPSIFRSGPIEIGRRGENTASIFEQYKGTHVAYIPPSSITNLQFSENIISAPLEEALTDWINYMEIALSINSRLVGPNGHELKVVMSNDGIESDLTNVGVGVSQVLPILVMGLLSNRDSTLIFEQPELHLHPRAQSRLADFFLSLIYCDKQCIVETHSEHLVNQLRLRAVEAQEGNELHKFTKIFFVEKKPSEESSFKEIEIDEFGTFNHWPKDFFDQTHQHSEKIVNSSFEKQNLIKGKKNV